MISFAALLLVLAGELAPNGSFDLPGAAKGQVSNHRLVLRRRNETASLPLPEDVTGVERVTTGRTATTLSLERFCPPGRTLVLTKGDIDARFLFEKANALWKKGSKAEAIDRLKEAVAVGAGQTDVRLALAVRQLETGSEAAAVDTLKAAPPDVAVQTCWAALEDAKAVSLVARLGLPQSVVRLGRDQPNRLLWSRGRKWFAWVGVNGVEIRGADGTPVFIDAIARAKDMDDDGNVVPRRVATVQHRWANVERLFGAFGFEPFGSAIAPDQSEVSRDLYLSWLRWKSQGLVASAGGNMIRVRRAGAVVFEKEIQTQGNIRVEWGEYVTEGPYLFVGWGRWSGADECPEKAGVEIVHLPPAPGVPSKQP